jgi:hypothetical protein
MLTLLLIKSLLLLRQSIIRKRIARTSVIDLPLNLEQIKY